MGEDVERFTKKSLINHSIDEVFRWHTQPEALQRLTPPWINIEVVEQKGGIQEDSKVTIRLKRGPFFIHWKLRHDRYHGGEQFWDIQERGPFKLWEHCHHFSKNGDGCLLEDSIIYKLPFGFIGRWLLKDWMQNQLTRLFTYRHTILKKDLKLHKEYSSEKKNVVITGSSGLIGSSLVPFLKTGGHQVKRLVRHFTHFDSDSIFWDPQKKDGGLFHSLNGTQVVINLSGENLSEGRWTEERKRRIRESRLLTTQKLCENLLQLEQPPELLINASAIGYYGDRGELILDETSEKGEGFLADLCADWEKESAILAERGIRIVNFRFGVVLSPKGGALKKMLIPFEMGLGGVLGSGKQYMSWIALDDVLAAILHAINRQELQGAINVVSPNPVTNDAFTKTLGRVLHRPTILSIPSFALRALLGKMADECLLSSTRVIPSKLQSSGFSFLFPNLEDALRHVLGR